MSGRFVIVQMDNGHDALNLKEVKAFGQSGNITKMNLFVIEKEKMAEGALEVSSDKSLTLLTFGI